MITIYNEVKSSRPQEDRQIREEVESFFDEHSYLSFTNLLVWIKAINPSNSSGQELFECSIEARLPNKEPEFVSKKNQFPINATREALDAIKDEIIKVRDKSRARIHPPTDASPY